MSNLLDLADQTVFLAERATGATNLVQCVWRYDRAIDFDGVRRFQRHLQRGRLSRRIERSPLPFGRHRWVSPSRSADVEIVATPRPREELDGWLREQIDTPLDVEHGPGWHLAVLPFTGGGAAVSLVVSHCLVDGVGLCEALSDAACGRDSAIVWPAAASRRRWRAVREDIGQTARDTRAIRRAAVAAARLARQSRRSGTEIVTAPRTLPAGSDERIDLPMTTIFLDADEWDARAYSLGGTANALLAGLAARLAQQVGRVAADGSVMLSMPINERTPGDTRANAVTDVDITVDPAPAPTDLRGIRGAIKQALIRRAETPDEKWALLPLVPLVPKRLAKRMVSVASGGAVTVVSSNLGSVDPAVNRPDGTDADYFALKSVYPGVTRATMHHAGGVLALLSGRVHGQVFVSVLAYQPDGPNSNALLQQRLSDALGDFSLTATGWEGRQPVGGAR